MPNIFKLYLKKLPGGVLQARLANAAADPKAVKTGPEYAKMFKAGLEQFMPFVRIDLIIDSRGGALESALGLTDALDACERPIRVLIAGQCGSAATLPAFYCEHVESIHIVPGGSVLIHMPKIERYTRKRGSAIWSMVEKMGTASSTHLLMGCYARKTGAHKRTIREWMEKGTVFSPDQAVAAGFCDGIMERWEWESGAPAAGVRSDE